MALMIFSRFRCLIFVQAALCLGAAGRAGAANLMVNGEFVSGTTGWRTVGTVFDTGETAVLSDQVPTPLVLFQTVSMPVETVISLTLYFDLFEGLSPVAALGQTPDTVFLTAFLGSADFGNSYVGGIYDEAVNVADVDFRGPANTAPGLTSGASPKGAEWTRYSLALPVRGFVTVAFEFIDGNGIAGDSTAAVDNVVLDAVLIPEPGVFSLFAGLAVLAPRRRRNGPVILNC